MIFAHRVGLQFLEGPQVGLHVDEFNGPFKVDGVGSVAPDVGPCVPYHVCHSLLRLYSVYTMYRQSINAV